MTPTWAKPFAPPPPNTSATLGALTGVACMVFAGGAILVQALVAIPNVSNSSARVTAVALKNAHVVTLVKGVIGGVIVLQNALYCGL